VDNSPRLQPGGLANGELPQSIGIRKLSCSDTATQPKADTSTEKGESQLRLPRYQPMKPDDIKRLFPNASASLFAANSGDPELPKPEKRAREKAGDDASMRPELERHPLNAAVGKGKAKAGDSRRFLVRVTSIRRRPIDEDNLCEKYVIDCCRYAGLLPGDGPLETKIETSQRKAGKEEQERTVVEIYAADA